MTAILVEGRRINPPQLVGDRSRFGQPPALTPSELAVLRLLATGITRKEIAEQRGSVYSTVNNHASNAFRKLGARSTVEMMNLMGWVRVER
jgi:DNA-binding NarL/FixJ family response regulator